MSVKQFENPSTFDAGMTQARFLHHWGP